MADLSKRTNASFPTRGYYIRDSEENWYIREDVAGYEYPEEGANYRIGIPREVMQRPDDIAPLLDILNAPFNKFITRNMVRAVITKALLLHPSDHLRPLLAADLEAVISLEDSGNVKLADCYQVIFGRNHPSRQTPQGILAQELVKAEQVFAEAKKRGVQPASWDQLKATYLFERITNESGLRLIGEYENLAKATFGYMPEDTELFLDDSVFIAAMAEQNGQRTLVGGSFAWRDITYLKRNGQDVTLDTYEISGSVVQKKYRGKGIYKGIVLALLTFLAQQPEPIDIVFSFSNIQEHALMAIAAQTGKTLVTETARDLYLSIKPAVQQNRIEGRYVDDIVTYLPGQQLRRLYRANEPGSV